MGPSILSECFNALGRLEGEPLARLRAVLARPSQETWDAACNLIIAPDGHVRTLWQAVLAVKPDFPRSKPPDEPWSQIPDSMTIARAIRNASGKWMEQQTNVPLKRVLETRAVMVESAQTDRGEFTILWRYDGARAELFHDGVSIACGLLMPEARKMAGDIFNQTVAISESERDDDEMGPR